MKRERSIFEIMAIIGEETEEAIDLFEQEHIGVEFGPEDVDIGRNREKFEQILEYLQALEKKEIKKINQKIGSEKLENQCLELYQDTEKLEKAIEQGNSKAVYQFLKRIEEIEREIYEEIEIFDLSDYEIEEQIGEGSRWSAFSLKNNPNKIMVRRNFGEADLLSIKRRFANHKQVPDNINFARILEIGLYEGEPVEIQERAKGTVLHQKDESYKEWSQKLSKYSEIPVNHYSKLYEDFKTLRRYNLGIDTQTPRNFFYSNSQGFYLIDLTRKNPGEQSSRNKPENMILPIIALHLTDSEKMGLKDINNIEQIYRKMREAGFPRNSKVENLLN